MENRAAFYKNKIIKQLYFERSLSCADISEKINKSLPLTVKILNELIEEGIVIETGYAASTGGRKPLMYSLSDDHLYIVAVAMDQFITRIALLNLKNKYVTSIAKIDMPLQKDAGILLKLSDEIERFISQSGIEKNKIAGVGIAMPGFVDVIKGTNYTYFETEEGNINKLISDKINLPVFIDNDSSSIALAELWFGAASGKKNAMVINAGWGIGLGMILNGALFRGHNGFAGEFSHIPLFTNDKMCACGKTGCLETEASLLVVVEKAKKAVSEGRVTLLKNLNEHTELEKACKAVIEAAAKGDKLAVDVLSEAGYIIGRGVAILIHLLNPEVVILSGRGSSAGKIWHAPIQQALNEHCIPQLGFHTEIKISPLGYEAELIGAAVLVMERYEKNYAKAQISDDKMPSIFNNN